MGVTGPSGAGKTLLLRALADMDPYEGVMRLDGRDAADMPAHEWRARVGLLPAESVWWFDTVGEHFDRLPPDWLTRLGFSEKAMTWQIAHLSSGERQRFALLRLLAGHPHVLLLDEPTANLDAENSARVEALIHHYRKSHHPVILWVSHDTAQLQRCCDSVWALEHGALRRTAAPGMDPAENLTEPAP